MDKQIILITLLSMLVFLSACNVGKAIFQQDPLVTRTITGTEVTLRIKDSVNENIIIAEQLPLGTVALEFSVEPVINEEEILVWMFSEQAPTIIGGFRVLHKHVPTITYTITEINKEIAGKWGLLTSEIEGEIPTLIIQEAKLKNVNKVKTKGTKRIEIRAKGKKLEEITAEEVIEIYNENKKIIKFTHDFSELPIDLSEVEIEKTTTSIVVNFSNQLKAEETKTLYLENKNFVKLCVKDVPMQSQTEISSSCTGEGEYDFTECLSTGTLRIEGINCTIQENIIRIENLTHSGVKGTVAAVDSGSGSRGSGGGSGGGSSDDKEVFAPCKEDWICEGFKDCVNGKKTQRCFDGNNCGTTLQQPLMEKECVEVVVEELVEESQEVIAPEVLTPVENVEEPNWMLITILAIFVITFIVLVEWYNKIKKQKLR